MEKRVNVPEWYSHGSIYQINPRTFSSEGTISAVTRELPYLASLGFTTMYLCPIYREDDSTDEEHWSTRQKNSKTGNPKNPYRMTDYFSIDSEYGTNEDLKDFIKEAHRLGLYVMLDLVYLHIGPGAEIFESHPEFAKHNQNGSIQYSNWSFPSLDFECEGLREYLFCNMVYYISVFDVDGFRCDVGDGIPADFWAEGKRRITAVKHDAVLLNEGHKYEYMLSGFESCYCFDWHSGLYKIITGEKTAAEFAENMKKLSDSIPPGGMLVRDMDNHDTVTDWPDRVENLVGHDGMETILTAMYLIDGIPMVYCGNEIADNARLSMFANRFYPGKFSVTDREKLKNTDAGKKRAELMKSLNDFRRKEDVCSYGKTEWLRTNCPEKVIAFTRTLGDTQIFYIGNLGDKETDVTIEGYTFSRNGTVFLENEVKRISFDENRILLGAYGYLVMILK